MQNRVGLDAKHDPTPSCCSSSLIFNTTTAIHGCELTSLACLKLATFSAGALLLFVTVRPDYHTLGSARMCHGILIHSRPSHSVFAHSYLARSSFPSTCICICICFPSSSSHELRLATCFTTIATAAAAVLLLLYPFIQVVSCQSTLSPPTHPGRLH